MEQSDAWIRKVAAQQLHTDEQCRMIAARYADGVNFRQLGREYGGATDTIRRAITRGGGVLPPNQKPKFSDKEKATMRRMVSEGSSLAAVARQLGRSTTTVVFYAHEEGLRPAPRVGPRAATWAGGRQEHRGYVYCWIPRDDDPLAVMRSNAGYVAEHRLAMARFLGRPLLAKETVHHINGNGLDNRLENLQLRQGKHGKGVVMCCLDCGSRRIGPKELGG